MPQALLDAAPDGVDGVLVQLDDVERGPGRRPAPWNTHCAPRVVSQSVTTVPERPATTSIRNSP